MFTIIIQEKGGEQRRMVFNKPEVTIGRVQGNDIVLPKGNVSKRHARIVLKDGKFIIVDLKSTNGTYVNGRKITSPLVVKDSDKIYIGDFIVGVDEAANEGDGPSETTTSPPERHGAGMPPDARPPRPTEAAPQPMPIPMGNPMGMGGPMGNPIGGPVDRGMSMDRGPMDRPPMGGPPPMGGGMERPMGGGMDRPPPMGMERAPMGGPPEPPPPVSPPTPSAPPPLRPGPSRPPMSGPPREPPQPGERSMPPISSPPPNRAGVRPGGTMPPPVQPPPQAAPPPMHEPYPSPAASAPMPVQSAPAAMAPSIAPAPAPAPVVPLQKDARRQQPAPAKKLASRPISSASKRGVHLEPLDSKIVKMLDLQSNILERLRTKLDLDKVPLERLHEEELWQKAERATIDLVETLETSGELPKYIDQDALIKETLNEALALGPLEDLLADEGIDEILIDRRDRIVVGKNGQLRGSGKAFSSDEVFERVVKRLVDEAGATIDDAHPVVDLRMRDGTRLTAAVSPVASRGACLVLKKAPASMPSLQDLVAQGALSAQMADFLTTCITARRNVLVCGGPGSGKTTVIGALAAATPAGERVVSVEEVAELAIARDEWIQLETRPANSKSSGFDMSALLDTALRLVPDRLVVGDVRGREAMTLVLALTSNVDGAIVGMTGEGANQALGRLATLARATHHMATDALREVVATAFEIVVHVVRTPDGNVKVHSIEEVSGVSETTFETEPVFALKDGNFAASGRVPQFYSAMGADQAVFR